MSANRNGEMADLMAAMHHYKTVYPPYVFDTRLGARVCLNGICSVERWIGDRLALDADSAAIREGLASVLAWGFARSGYWRTRVDEFLGGVAETDVRLLQARDALHGPIHGRLRAMAALRLPQFTQMPFVSKAAAFADIDHMVVLDRIIARAARDGGEGGGAWTAAPVFDNLAYGQAETTIRISAGNEAVYHQFRLCCDALARLLPGEQRPVDVERGLWLLASGDRVDLVVGLLRRAGECRGDGGGAAQP